MSVRRELRLPILLAATLSGLAFALFWALPGARLLPTSGPHAGPDVLLHSSWGQYRDSAGRFALRYPPGWKAEPLPEGLALWPPDSGAALLVSVEPAAPPPPFGAALAQPPTTERVAEHVAVGGLSGVERVRTISPISAQSAVRGEVGAASAHLEPMTVVVWQAATSAYQVVMLDALDAQQLPLLEQVRDTLEWGESAPRR